MGSNEFYDTSLLENQRVFAVFLRVLLRGLKFLVRLSQNNPDDRGNHGVVIGTRRPHSLNLREKKRAGKKHARYSALASRRGFPESRACILSTPLVSQRN